MKKLILITLLSLYSCSTEEEPIDTTIDVCPEIYAPVCGPDGTEYPNECFARQQGLTSFTGCGLQG